MATQLTDGKVLQQTQIKLENKNLLGLILPTHQEYDANFVTRLPLVTGAKIANVNEGDPIPLTDMVISEAKLEAKKRATIMLLSKELVKRSPEGAVSFLVNNIEQAITTEMYKDIEAITNATSAKIEDGLGQVSHLTGGGIILIKDMVLAKQFLNLPDGYKFVLANITSKAIIIPANSVAVCQHPTEVTEDTEAMVNLKGNAGLGTPDKIVSLFQQNLIGIRVIKHWDIKAIATIVKVA